MPLFLVHVTQAGVVVFDGVTEYSSYEQWVADEGRHCVPPGSPYGWQPGESTQALKAELQLNHISQGAW